MKIKKTFKYISGYNHNSVDDCKVYLELEWWRQWRWWWRQRQQNTKKTTRGISLTQMTISDKMIDTKAFIQSRSNSHSRGLSHNTFNS